MRRRIIQTEAVLVMLLLCTEVMGMQLDSNSIAEITTDPCHQMSGYSGSFVVSGNVAAWIDQRDPDWTARIYGVKLDDAEHREFLIDMNAGGCSRIAMSWPVVVYDVWPAWDVQVLKVADITDQNNPVWFEFWPLIQYADYIDVSGGVVAYCGYDANNEYRYTVCAADISDGNNVRQHTISVLPSGNYASGLAIDGGRIIWSGNSGEPNGYVQAADITDLNNPEVATALLTEETVFDQVDASRDWLVAHGRREWQSRIFAVHNYPDVNNWDVQTLWREGDGGEYYMSGPRIDGPIAVWVTNTRMPSLRGLAGPLQQETEYFLKGGYLTGNGVWSVSTLLRDPCEIGAADTSHSQVVWSQVHEMMDLYKGTIKLGCGDWGYKPRDLDRNCKVDLLDFAIFAEDWLECTMPDDPQCGYGSLRYEGPKLD